MDLSQLISPDLQPILLEIGRSRDWMKLTTVERHGMASTDMAAIPGNLPKLGTPARRLIDRLWGFGPGSVLNLMVVEVHSRILADGPKLFRPTAEQFESMEHVELRMPPSELRTPYPALVIGVPNECRRSLADRTGAPLAKLPQVMSVRRWETGHCLVTIPIPGTGEEEHYQFGDHPLNPTIEAVITRWMTGSDRNFATSQPLDPATLPPGELAIKRAATLMARSALNLCMMLAHFGCHVTGPVDPVAWRKHRSKPKLERFKHADFQAVELKQQIVVRNVAYAPSQNPPGPGLGVEVKPHWRKGYWRAYPGQGAARAAGEQVPLLFVRPCLVRADRVVGDLSDTEATYTG